MKKDIKISLWYVGRNLGFLSILAVTVLWLWVEPESVDDSEEQESFNAPSTFPQPSAQSIPSNLEQGTLGISGGLRVSNWTQYPVRIVLRKFTDTSEISEPIHWDFAPGEGGEQGLILSLPQNPVQLGKGDILVAFAQDGSRIYWGPYTVGETSIPLWNADTSEWFLILQP